MINDTEIISEILIRPIHKTCTVLYKDGHVEVLPVNVVTWQTMQNSTKVNHKPHPLSWVENTFRIHGPKTPFRRTTE